MDIQKLEYFFAAADTGNFTHAAEQCQVAQTTMSKYISTLEAEMGCRLFYRTNKGCSLTEQGQLFYESARRIEKEYIGLLAELHRTATPELKLGLNGVHFYLDFLKDFEQSHPEISLHLSFGKRETLIDDLNHQRIDGIVLPNIIMEKPKATSDIRTVDILSVQDVLVFSEAVGQKYETVADALEDLPFITKSPDTAYYDFCRHHLKRAFGKTFSDVRIASNNAEQNMFISLSQGFGIVPDSEIPTDDEYRIVPLGPEFQEVLQLVYNKHNRSGSLRELIRTLK